MKRDLPYLAAHTHDLLVIGGGISGACVAWDAALRGLHVALVERDDFGAATSANSLKTLHGGLRYLQDADLRLVRKMVRERGAFLRIAPHLTRPLPCLMPTYHGRLMRSKLILGTAVKLNDLLSLDRNRGMAPDQTLPGSRILSRADCLARLPGLDDPAISGGVLWYDGQITNSERLLLAFLLSAAECGAQVANYAAVTDLIQQNGRVIGAQVEDRLSGDRLNIQARVVVNTAGPWADEVLAGLNGRAPAPRFHPSTAMNLVTRQILPDLAVGLTSRYERRLTDGTTETRSRVLFVAPWGDHSIVGTRHTATSDSSRHWGQDGRPDEAEIADFLAEVNRAYPAARLTRADVFQVHHGRLPAEPGDGEAVQLIRSGQVTDHAAAHNVEGLITAVGVKYTTARFLAEKTVNLVFRKLERTSPPCQTPFMPLVGGRGGTLSSLQARALAERPYALPPETVNHWLSSYGSGYAQFYADVAGDMALAQPVGPETVVTRAEIRHAVRCEMAQTLDDVIRRRTALGSAGPPPPDTAQAVARLMAAELGWSDGRIDRELDALYDGYLTAHHPTPA